MSDNKALLRKRKLARIRKAILFSDIASAGALSPEDADAFITYMLDEGAAVFAQVRTESMYSDTKNIDVFELATRQTRKKEPGQAPIAFADGTFSRNILNAVKTVFPLEIEEEVFEENIEKEGYDTTLMQRVAVAVSNDQLDLAFNGDEASADPFLNINDGWIALGLASGNTFDATGASDKKAILAGMLAAHPRWFKTDKSKLRFMVDPTFEEEFRIELSGRATGLGDAYLDEDRRARYLGVLVQPIGPMPTGNAILAVPTNMVVGVEYAIRVERDKDILRGVHQVVVTMKTDFELAIDSAMTVAHDIP